MARILIVNSSPRTGSNTRILAGQVAEGAVSKGHTVTTRDIGRMEMKPCIGCEACRERPGACVFQDGLSAMYGEIAEAEVIILSSPIYYFTVNAQMKIFLDRTYAVPGAFRNKRVGGVFAYGDVDPVKSGCINAIRMFQDICNFELIRATWIGAVYGTMMAEREAEGLPELLAMAREFGESIA